MSFSLARTRKQQRKRDQKSTDIHPPRSQHHQRHFGQAVLEKWGSTFSWMCIMIQPNVSEDFPETPDVSQEKLVFRSTLCSTQSRATYKVGGDWEKLIFVSSPLLTEGFHSDHLQCSHFGEGTITKGIKKPIIWRGWPLHYRGFTPPWTMFHGDDGPCPRQSLENWSPVMVRQPRGSMLMLDLNKIRILNHGTNGLIYLLPKWEKLCHGNKCLRTYWGEQINLLYLFHPSFEHFHCHLLEPLVNVLLVWKLHLVESFFFQGCLGRS